MTDDIRARHFKYWASDEPNDFACEFCEQKWPCDAFEATARANKAEAALADKTTAYRELMEDSLATIERARALADELAGALGMTACINPMGEEATGTLCARCAALAKWEASRAEGTSASIKRTEPIMGKGAVASALTETRLAAHTAAAPAPPIAYTNVTEDDWVLTDEATS